MQGQDVAMNIEVSIGRRPWGKHGTNQILKSENGKEEK